MLQNRRACCLSEETDCKLLNERGWLFNLFGIDGRAAWGGGTLWLPHLMQTIVWKMVREARCLPYLSLTLLSYSHQDNPTFVWLCFTFHFSPLPDPGLPQCVRAVSSWEKHAWYGGAAGGRRDRDVWLQLQAVGPLPSALCPCAAVGRDTHWCQHGGHGRP